MEAMLHDELRETVWFIFGSADINRADINRADINHDSINKDCSLHCEF